MDDFNDLEKSLGKIVNNIINQRPNINSDELKREILQLLKCSSDDFMQIYIIAIIGKIYNERKLILNI
jgi:hypothetical protein